MKKQIAMITTLGVVASLLGATAAFYKQREREAPAVLVSAPAPVIDEIVLSFAGDCTIGSDPRFGYAGSFHARFLEEGENHAYFFENVAPIFRADSLTFVNFEGTLTESDARADKAYTFKGPAHYARILTAGSVEAVSLSNNHTYDFLEKGFADTKEALKNEKIAYAYTKKPLLLSVRPGEVAREADGEKTEGEVYIGIVAFSVWYDDSAVRREIKESIALLREAGADLVFASFHWGIEGKYEPYEVQRAIGRFTIDAGADGVLGHHPHVLQGIETYKDREIVYSLGNFCFGGNRNPLDKDAFIYQLAFETVDGVLSGKKESRIIPCRISSTKSYNDYRPTPLSGEEEARVREKIRTHSAF